MAPNPFLPYPANDNATFTYFTRLPQELRFMIWEFALPPPRLVHLTRRPLRTDDDPDWWKRVRSDKVIDGPPLQAPYPEADEVDTENYGFFDLDDDDIDCLEREMARKRLLTKDEDYKGSMTRRAAKAILRQYSYPRVHQGPATLRSVRSDCEIPPVLLVCKESYDVASKSYTRAFHGIGALPQTWFDFSRDTIYLDEQSFCHDVHPFLSWELPHYLESSLSPEQMAQVENIAYYVRDDEYFTTRIATRIIPVINSFTENFPNLKRFTLVTHHFTRENRRRRIAADYQGLKYVEATTDSITGDFRLRGFRVDHSIPKPPISFAPANFKNMVQIVKEEYRMIFPEISWKLPVIEIKYKSVITEADEKRILELAMEFEKEHSAGCWYINPQDKSDCDYYVDGNVEEDEEAARLIDH